MVVDDGVACLDNGSGPRCDRAAVLLRIALQLDSFSSSLLKKRIR
jgi:hypothetical protein